MLLPVSLSLMASLGAPVAAAATPMSIDRIEADLRWLTVDIGPRPEGSTAEQAALAGVHQRLLTAGWEPVYLPGGLLACRGEGTRLMLAHVDTVEESPGAIDNAAGVATLLELARTTEAGDLCLGFPEAEESGLVGSRELARAAVEGHAAFPSGVPQLTVALDLAGQGRLAAMGLGPAWTDARRAWLTDAVAPMVETPYAYQVYSRVLPWAERSDHAPFAWAGGLSMHLLGLGDSDVFAHYHQPSDTRWERDALVELHRVLDQLATAPPLPLRPAPDGVSDWGRTPEDAGLLLYGVAVPSWLTWLVVVAALGSGAADYREARALPWQVFYGTTVAVVMIVVMALFTKTHVFSPSVAEQTAAAVMGVPLTGWWTGAVPAVVVSAGLWLWMRHRFARVGSAPLGAGLTTALVAWIDPVFALPFAVGGLLSRLHPVLAVLPAAYLLRPDALRQLTFHGLLQPEVWGLVWLLAWPAVGGYGPGSSARGATRTAGARRAGTTPPGS